MSISIQKKFKSIKRDFLSDGAKGILDQMAKATDNFKDYTAVKKIRPKFESFFDKIKASKPEAIVGFVTKPKRAKKTRANAARTAAYKRRQPQGGVPKDYKDIEKDARRPAISIKGKRTSKTGKTYYEYRDNRWDKRPKRYPKLAKGGEVNYASYDNKSKEYIEGEIAHTERSARQFRQSGDEATAKDRENHAKKLWEIYYKKRANGGYMAKGGETLMMGDEEVYIKKSSIGLEDEVCLFYKKDDSILKCISKNQFDKFIEQGKLVPKKEHGGYMADGGEIDKGNAEMIMSTTKSIKHHANELQKLVSMNTPIEAWVVAKLERAETDLSDVTHYIDGLRNEDHMAKGGYTGEPHRLEK